MHLLFQSISIAYTIVVITKRNTQNPKLPNPCVKTEQFKCERESQKNVYDRQHQARHLNTRSCSTCLEKQKTENASQLIFLFIDIIVHGHGVIANDASFLGRIAAVCTKTGCTAVQVCRTFDNDSAEWYTQ